MKISTKGRYGLRILLDLATHDSDKPRLIRDIAKSQNISEKYISRLIIDLRRARLVRSIRGANGGFHLAKAPREITLLDILETMEGTISIVDCVLKPEVCSHIEHCAVRTVWENLNNEIRALMRKTTLEDIIEAHKAMEIPRDTVQDYCI